MSTAYALPQLADDVIFLTDSGLETDLIFHGGLELPEFAAFPLLDDVAGRAALTDYFLSHAAIAARHGSGFVFEAPTWRANPDWGAQVGYDTERLRAANVGAIGFMRELRTRSHLDPARTAISGNIGPRGDAYNPVTRMSADEAQAYHRAQVYAFAEAGANLTTAMTIGYADEAIGIIRVAGEVALPVVVSFTVDTEGRLPDGSTLADTLRVTEEATDGRAAYFMVNCAHPDYMALALAPADDGLRVDDDEAPWRQRIRGVRANASRRSHAELDQAPDLDEGDPSELAQDYLRLTARFPQITVLGGCCGTDARHVAAIADVCVPA